MATTGQSNASLENNDADKFNDEVDPRVQIELERLNTATDDINKLEVDLDEARAAFRQLLCESTVRIDTLAKKLGACVERARPYYEARMKAKEALQETQQAAVRFERANSAHAAAKEMVYLAEEGLSTEGRTFDHAWQEMLNHATMRVNESERDRTLGELEHRRTSQCYHRTEMRVQQLQKELKRAIAKSRPYFEMKAQFNQVLEDQKRRVKSLESQVGGAKASYAEALRNLEQISDEIHRTRKYETLDRQEGDPLGARGPGVGAESPLQQTACSPDPPSTGPPSRKISLPGLSSSSLLDTDVWSDSTGTGPPDSESEEFLRLPEKLGTSASPIVPKADTVTNHVSDYLGLSALASGRVGVEHAEVRSQPLAELAIHSQDTLQSSSMSPRHIAAGVTLMETSFVDKQRVQTSRRLEYPGDTVASFPASCPNPAAPFPSSATNSFPNSATNSFPNSGTTSSEVSDDSPQPMLRDDSRDQIWTEISLVDSPDDSSSSGRISETFAKMGPSARLSEMRYSPLTEDDVEGQDEALPIEGPSRNSFLPFSSDRGSFLPASSPLLARARSLSCRSPSRNQVTRCQAEDPDKASGMPKSTEKPPIPPRARLDSSLSGWMSRTMVSGPDPAASPNNRRQSLDTLLWGSPTTERVKELLSHGMMMLNIASLTERRASEPRTEKEGLGVVPDQVFAGKAVAADSRGNLILTKKVPSPLEKSMTYLNAEDDSTSDSESLASVEMLTDDQISSLMLDQDIQDACEEVLGTPISEISPLIQDLAEPVVQGSTG